MKSGNVYLVNLDPTVGDEIKKKRPVVILNGGHEKHLKLCIVVPVTNWNSNWENNPFFASLEPNPTNGLKKKSAVDCFQIRAISHRRFSEQIGRITKYELNSIKKSISLILDIDPEHCE